MAERRIRDITGQVFGKLVVIGIAETKRYNKGMAIYFSCKCECGNIIKSQRSNLVFGGKTSCGCDSKKTAWTFPKGASSHELFKVWAAMIDRCSNQNNKSFRDYGSRGISVSDRWVSGESGLTGFECFLADMGARPSRNYTIERMDNDRGYGPDNCVWMDRKGQNSNKRSNIIIEIGGHKLTVADWARRKGISEFTIYRRLRTGWDKEKAVLHPVRHRK